MAQPYLRLAKVVGVPAEPHKHAVFPQAFFPAKRGEKGCFSGNELPAKVLRLKKRSEFGGNMRGLEEQQTLNTELISIDIGDDVAKKVIGFTPKNILRYPRLDTVLMVEKAIQEAGDYPTKASLWKSLPKKTMYQTFCLILDYLEYSGKIFIAKNGEIIWVWDPVGIEKLRRKGLLLDD